MAQSGYAANLPSISVVMSCRNSGDTLAATLESLEKQHYPGEWEVVVVDNGSTDDTVTVARRFESRLPALSVHRRLDPGYQASGQNFGVERSKGECLIFLDGDDIAGSDYILHMGRALAQAPFVGAAMDVEVLNPPSIRQRRTPMQQHRIETLCGFRCAVVSAAMGVRREAFDKVGGFDEALETQTDVDLSWRLIAAGYSPTFVPEAVLHYRYRAGAADIFRQERGYARGAVQLYRKFRGEGMPRRTLPRVLVSYARMALTIPGLWREDGLARLATQAGSNLGLLEASIRQRTLYL
jgi:GT2 family glycosyltransferase